MDYKPSKQEWTELLRSLLSQGHKRSARRKLCRLHKGPIKESTVQCPWPDGRNCFAKINAQGMKMWLVAPDSSSFYIAYNANGDQVDVGHTGHALDWVQQ